MGQCQSVCTSKTAPGSPREKDDRGLEPSSSGAGGGKNPASVLNLGKEAEMYFAKGGKVWYQKVREGTRPRRRGRGTRRGHRLAGKLDHACETSAIHLANDRSEKLI